MSKLLKAAQVAIASSGMTHEQIAKAVGTERQRIGELMNKEDIRGTLILEKVLELLKEKEFSTLTRTEKKQLGVRLGVHKVEA